MREGDFHPKLLPYRQRASLDLTEAVFLLYTSGMSTRAISRFIEAVYGAFYSQESFPPHPGGSGGGQGVEGTALDEEYEVRP